MHRLFAQLDCNNFYASCERAMDPSLAGRPVVILSNNDGCVIARSAEAKAAGIPMGAPYFTLREQAERCGAVVLSSNYALYGDLSARVMRFVAGFARGQEVYSIDECFLDITGEPEPQAWARGLRETVLRALGLPVCIGIGPSMTLAKVANGLAKGQPAFGGVFDWQSLDESERLAQLGQMPVESLWGVGQRLGEAFRRQGIGWASELVGADREWLRRHFGIVVARLADELAGRACLTLAETVPPRKMIMSTRSFGYKVQTLSDLKEAVAHHAALAAEKLRRQASLATFLRVSIRTSRFAQGRFEQAAEVVPLLPATDDTRVLVRAAQTAVERLWRPGLKYHKAGVMLMDLTDRVHAQADLFAGSPLDEKRTRVMQTMDAINRQMGRGTLKIAAEGTTQAWKMKQERLSPRYTTRWEDIPVAKAK